MPNSPGLLNANWDLRPNLSEMDDYPDIEVLDMAEIDVLFDPQGDVSVFDPQLDMWPTITVWQWVSDINAITYDLACLAP